MLLVVFSILALASISYLLISARNGSKTMAIPKPDISWQKPVEEYFYSQKRTAHDELVSLNSELTSIFYSVLRGNIKLTESTEDRSVFVIDKIIVEGDVQLIRDILQKNEYSNIALSEDYKEIIAEKNGEKITFTFSIDTTNYGKIEIDFKS